MTSLTTLPSYRIIRSPLGHTRIVHDSDELWPALDPDDEPGTDAPLDLAPDRCPVCGWTGECRCDDGFIGPGELGEVA
jgi:hypothetical protein